MDDVRTVAQELPDANGEQGPEASVFSVRGRWFAVKSRHEEDAIVVHADPEERPLLVGSNPGAYYLAPRFEGRDHLGVRRERLVPTRTDPAPTTPPPPPGPPAGGGARRPG